MQQFIKSVSEAFDQAARLSRIVEQHRDPEEMRKALLTEIRKGRTTGSAGEQLLAEERHLVPA